MSFCFFFNVFIYNLIDFRSAALEGMVSQILEIIGVLRLKGVEKLGSRIRISGYNMLTQEATFIAITRSILALLEASKRFVEYVRSESTISGRQQRVCIFL